MGSNSRNIVAIVYNSVIMFPAEEEGGILFLVRILLASASASASA